MRYTAKKFLAAAITAHLLFSPITFAGVEQTEPQYLDTEVPASEHLKMLEMYAKNGVPRSDSGVSSLDERQAELDAKAAALHQAELQENQTSASRTRVVPISQENGVIVWGMDNPCFPCNNPRGACSDPYATKWFSSSVNSNGFESYSNGVYNCLIDTFKSDNTPMTAQDKINMNMFSRNMDFKASNFQTAVTQFAFDRNLSEDQKVMIMLNAILSDWNDRSLFGGQDPQTYFSMQEEEKQQKAENAEAMQRKIQEDYGVVGKITGDAPYKVKITPEVPFATDGKDVVITLVPKNKSVVTTSGGKEKYSITMRFTSQDPADDVGKQITRNVKENQQIVVERGDWDRTPGTRDVIVTYTDNETQQTKVSRFSYTVGQTYSVMTETGKTVNNAVLTAIMNEGFYVSSGQPFAMAGKILNSVWDKSKGACVVTVADDGINNDAVAIVETSNLTEDKCGSATGTYMSMNAVSAVRDGESGKVRFVDGGSSNQSVFNKTRDEYLSFQDQSDNAIRKNSNAQPNVLVGDMSKGYAIGGYGRPGADWIILPQNVVANVSYDDKMGRWAFTKPDGSAMDAVDLVALEDATGLDFTKISIDNSNPDKCVVSVNGSAVSRDYFIDSDYSSNRQSLYTSNKARLENGGLTLSNAFGKTADGIVKAII